jgi:hypothetical protein
MIKMSLKFLAEKHIVMELGAGCLWKGFQKVKYFCCGDIERLGNEHSLGRIQIYIVMRGKVAELPLVWSIS